MPGDRSLYRKMQVVLDEARSGGHRSLDGLIDGLLAKGPLNFEYRGRDPASGQKRLRCSRNSVTRAIPLCCDMGLVNGETDRLTRSGMVAVDRGRFDDVVAARVADRLDELGVSVKKMEAVITDKLLRASRPILPTSDALYDALGRLLRECEFRTYLNLLGRCGGIRTSQSRIYLPI